MDDDTLMLVKHIVFTFIFFSAVVMICWGFVGMITETSESIKFNKNAEDIVGNYTIVDIIYENKLWTYKIHYPNLCRYEIVLNNGYIVGTYIKDLEIGKDYKMHIKSGQYYEYDIMWLEECNGICEK